jgi:hypothetical protein
MSIKKICLLLSVCVFAVITLIAKTNKKLVTSQVVKIDTSTSEVLKSWFSPIQKPEPGYLNKQQVTIHPAPKITGLEHIVLHYNKETYCGHPRMVNFKYFPPNEIIVGHFHAPSKYITNDDVRHISYQSRSVCLLQRSTDMGKTWPRQNEIVLFDHTISKQQKEFLANNKNSSTKNYNMFDKNSVFFFANTMQYPIDSTFTPELLEYRSIDRGRTWAEQPIPVVPPSIDDETTISKQNTPIIQMPDGKTLLGSFWVAHALRREAGAKYTDGSAIFYSKDQGKSWHFLSRPVRDRSGDGMFIYETLFLAQNGDLHLYAVHLSNHGVNVDGVKNAINLCVSKDGGKTWTDPVPITGKGADAWGVVDDSQATYKIVYRAPWPIQLKDGRILVVFTRRKMPAGIGGIISSDEGKTWSKEFVIRNDAKLWDEGYPVGTQLTDGRVFIAYYFNSPDEKNKQGGTRFIAGSFFTINK